MNSITPGVFGGYVPTLVAVDEAQAGEQRRPVVLKRTRSESPEDIPEEPSEKVTQAKRAEELYVRAEVLLFRSTDSDMQQALALYRQSAGMGHMGAALMAAKMLLRSGASVAQIRDAENFFLQGVGKTGGEAERLLGDFYAATMWGKQCGETAMNYWFDGVAEGDFRCYHRLAVNYISGEIIPRNMENGYVNMSFGAQAGISEAQLGLANLLYEAPGGVEQDFIKARDWYAAAVDGGEIEAKYYLAQMYLEGEGGETLVEEGLALLRSIVHADEDAADLLADIYLNGKYGVHRDVLQGVAYLETARSLGSDRATKRLAKICLNGVGDIFPKDEEKAFKIYTEQADLGNEWAYFQAGRLSITLRPDSPPHINRGILYLERVEGSQKLHAKWLMADSLCKRGHAVDELKAIETYREMLKDPETSDVLKAEINYTISRVLFVSAHETVFNRAKGKAYLLKAARGGLAQAWLSLGDGYTEGSICIKNRNLAYKAYSEAARLGNKTGIFNKGYCLREGLGVKQNFAEAVRLNMMALRAGHLRAKLVAGFDFLYGRGVRADVQRAKRYFNESRFDDVHFPLGLIARMEGDLEGAVAHFKHAHRNKDMKATMHLAKMFRTGNGAEKNEIWAIHYFKVAARRGNIEAAIALCKMYSTGEGVERDLKEAFKWLEVVAKIKRRVQWME